MCSTPFGIFYLYKRKLPFNFGNSKTENKTEREEYENKPEKARDDRKEADSVPELKLEDFEDE